MQKKSMKCIIVTKEFALLQIEISKHFKEFLYGVILNY